MVLWIIVKIQKAVLSFTLCGVLEVAPYPSHAVDILNKRQPAPYRLPCHAYTGQDVDCSFYTSENWY